MSVVFRQVIIQHHFSDICIKMWQLVTFVMYFVVSGHAQPSDTWNLLKSLLRIIHNGVLTRVSTWALVFWDTGKNTGKQGCFVLIQNPNRSEKMKNGIIFNVYLLAVIKKWCACSKPFICDMMVLTLCCYNETMQTEDVMKSKRKTVSTENFCWDWWHNRETGQDFISHICNVQFWARKMFQWEASEGSHPSTIHQIHQIKVLNRRFAQSCLLEPTPRYSRFSIHCHLLM